MYKLSHGVVSVVIWTGIGVLHAQVDPGIRGGQAGAGQPVTVMVLGNAVPSFLALNHRQFPTDAQHVAKAGHSSLFALRAKSLNLPNE